MKDFRELIGTVWKCTECGHKNSISADDIYESEEDFRNYNK